MKTPFDLSAYQARIEALFARHPSFQRAGVSAYKPGLERMEAALEALGNPQRSLRCIHVAGTNGKGSVSNLLAAALASCGLKVGLYTSPHLVDFRERVRIIQLAGGTFRLISREQTDAFLQEYQALFDRLDLSFFEITTVLAFWFFAQEEVDAAVIECGLGGRLDSTNVITPLLSVVTNIGLDHCDLLGHTLAEVAGEKAGIIKAGVPAVVGQRGTESDPVFGQRAARMRAPLHFAQDEVPAEEAAALARGADLEGPFQADNFRTVLCALSVLASGGTVPELSSGKSAPGCAVASSGTDIRPRFGLTPQALEGMRQARQLCGFHGRWEKWHAAPDVLCDIGHNAHALRLTFPRLQALLERGRYRRLILVYGSVADKDLRAAMSLLPSGAEVILTAAASPRAAAPEDLLALWRELYPGEDGRVRVVRGVEEAVRIALRKADKDPQGTLVFIGGSAYVVAEAVKVLPGLTA